MKRAIFWLLSCFILMCITGCGPDNSETSGPGPVCTPITQGAWNDTDAQAMAHQVAVILLEPYWYDTFVNSHLRKPDVQVGNILNFSCQNISTVSLKQDLMNEIILTGKARNVTDTAGISDYVLTGDINVRQGTFNGWPVLYYDVNFLLVEVETGTRLYEISKIIKKDL